MPTKRTAKVRRIWLIIAVAALTDAGCRAAADAPRVVPVPAGPFIAGSDRAEREAAYRLDEQGYGHSVTRQQRWYEGERNRQMLLLPALNSTAPASDIPA